MELERSWEVTGPSFFGAIEISLRTEISILRDLKGGKKASAPLYLIFKKSYLSWSFHYCRIEMKSFFVVLKCIELI